MPSSHAPSVNFATKFNAFSAERGTLQARRLLQCLARPTTFLLMALCLLVAPSVWFISRPTARVPPSDFELEGQRPTQVRALRTTGFETATISPAADMIFSPIAGAESVKEPTTATRATPVSLTPVPPTLAPGREENSKHGRHERHSSEVRDYMRSSWKPPVLPVEVFRDVPPEECVRNPLWEKKVDPTDYEFGCEEINVS